MVRACLILKLFNLFVFWGATRDKRKKKTIKKWSSVSRCELCAIEIFQPHLEMRLPLIWAWMNSTSPSLQIVTSDIKGIIQQCADSLLLKIDDMGRNTFKGLKPRENKPYWIWNISNQNGGLNSDWQSYKGCCLNHWTLVFHLQIVPNAVSFWENALKVRRNVGAIHLNRKCENNQYFLAPDDPTQYCKNQCVETKCGEFVVPEEHLKSCHTCDSSGRDCKKVTDEGPGVNNTDFVLYVSAIPTKQCGESIGKLIFYRVLHEKLGLISGYFVNLRLLLRLV